MKLWLDDIRPAPPGWTLVKTVDEAKALLVAGGVEQASLDHDLGLCDQCWADARKMADETADFYMPRDLPTMAWNHGLASYASCIHHGTGYDLVCWLEANPQHWPPQKPKVHSANPVGAKRMRQAIDRHYGAAA